MSRRTRRTAASQRQRPTACRGAGAAFVPGTYPVSGATAEVLRDLDNPDGWFLYLDDVPHSYLDTGDPTRLEFEYVGWIGDTLDCLAPPGERLAVAHLGGGAFTLPRFVEASRPGSPQVVFEYDEKLVELVRSAFGARVTPHTRVRVTDARRGLARLPAGSQDVVIRDAFVGRDVPDHLCTLEFTQDVARVLRTDGTYVLNAADRPGLALVRSELATLGAVFEYVALITDTSVLRGRRYGNVVLLASHRELPVVPIGRKTSTGTAPARLLHGERIEQLVAGARVRHDPAPAAPEPAVEAE